MTFHNKSVILFGAKQMLLNHEKHSPKIELTTFKGFSSRRYSINLIKRNKTTLVFPASLWCIEGAVCMLSQRELPLKKQRACKTKLCSRDCNCKCRWCQWCQWFAVMGILIWLCFCLSVSQPATSHPNRQGSLWVGPATLQRPATSLKTRPRQKP